MTSWASLNSPPGRRAGWTIASKVDDRQAKRAGRTTASRANREARVASAGPTSIHRAGRSPGKASRVDDRQHEQGGSRG